MFLVHIATNAIKFGCLLSYYVRRIYALQHMLDLFYSSFQHS
jgi:hypothetical protein